jgi:hypothetical protein
MVDPARGPQGAVAGPKPNPELLGDGGILVPVASEPGGGYTMVRVSPGEPEHAEWLASIQRSRAYDPPQTTPVRADPPPPSVGRPAAGPAAGGFAFWDGQTFVGFGVLGLIVAAVLFFTNTGPFEGAGQEECIVTTIGGNTLCGDDARAWCDSTDSLRAMDAVNSAESQAACDKVRDR